MAIEKNGLIFDNAKEAKRFFAKPAKIPADMATLTCRFGSTMQGYPEININCGTETVATVHHSGRDREAEWKGLANAFSAAPDLLAACEALHDALSNILENPEGIDPNARSKGLVAINQSFKALIKAKGEP